LPGGNPGHGKHQTKILEKTGFLRRFQAQFENEKKELSSWNQGAEVLRHEFGLPELLTAGCASLSRPTR
jgi:hypothetical protein